MLEELSPEAIASLVASLPGMPLAEKEILLSELESLEHKKTLKRCREDFLEFCAYIYPDWKKGPHHRYMKPLLHKVRDGVETRLTVSMPPRFGKQLDHDTPILTQNRGWVRHGDLIVGDKVFHPSGMPTEVVGLSDEQTQDCEIETFDGAVIRCHENHEWTVYDRASAKWRTVETKFFEKQKLLSGERARFQLPLVHALQFPDADIPLDPYFLGAWLGDGRSSATDICGAEDDLVRIVDRIPHEKGSRWVHKDTGVVHQNFVGVVKSLRAIGVLNNKHIPTLYMHASERQRRELLAGLVDTDGTQDKTGRIHFDGLSERLVRDVAELARSFGYRVGVIQVPQDMREREIKATAPTWRCYWTPHDGQGGGTLPRKKAHRVRDRRQIGIKAVRRVAPSKGRCIQVASGDGLYLAGTHLTPTHNSETIAYLFVAWYLGHLPNHHIMMATHTAALSADFGRKVRNLLDTDKYKEIFPNTAVSKDKSAADNWTTTAGGKYLAIGIGANVAGHGAHLLVCDDLVSEQAILANPDAAFATAWEYMQVGPLQRLMPGGKIVMIGTRWGRKDPIGRALAWAENNPNSTPWHEVRFPAILPSGKSLWPEQWPVDQLLAKKAGMQPQFWAAQYMQEPTSEEGAILKREWWQIWEKEDPPDVEFVMQVWDTAHDTKSHNDFSACITWGVFFNETTNRHELIMLNAIKGRWEFPQLKQKALDEYKEWQPECLLIEKKAAGAPLIQELRQMDMIIEEYSPSRAGAGVSNDKRARVNSVAPLLFDKVVWAPDHRWAFEVINECAEFPHGEHDDFVDCVSMCLARYRRGGFVSLSSDRKDEPQLFRRRSAAYY